MDFYDKPHIRLRDRARGSTFESFGKEREEENRAQEDAHVLLVEVKVEWEKDALVEAHVAVVEVLRKLRNRLRRRRKKLKLKLKRRRRRERRRRSLL